MFKNIDLAQGIKTAKKQHPYEVLHTVAVQLSSIVFPLRCKRVPVALECLHIVHT